MCSFSPVYAEDVADTAAQQPLSEAVETLVALKILEGGEDGDLMLGKVLTRAEFVTILVRLLNVEFGSTQIYFEDVGNDHWAASAIGAAASLGIVQGVDDKNFAPDAPLAIEEAIKMLVCALGYEPMALGKGGYPNGYMAVAHNLHLLKGLSAKSNIIVKREMAAELIFNTLDADLVIEDGYTAGNSTASIQEGVTLLSDKMKIKKGEGIVRANEVTSLSTSGGLSEGQVKIGDKIFFTGDTNAQSYLGYTVTYYCDNSENEDVQTLLYVRVEENKNEVVTVYSRDIQPSTNVRELVYTENKKTRTEKISTLADVLYNGMGTGGRLTNIVPANGYVTLIDNNSDSAADVVMVYDFETIVADKVNTAGYIAYDSKNADKYVELDPESRDYVFTIFENGQIADFDAIRPGSVLSVATSNNSAGKKQITVLVSNLNVTEQLSAVGDGEAVIGEETYYIMSGLEATLSKFLGKEAVFYINSFGEVAGISEEIKSLFKYGYLMAYGTSGTLSKKTELKILTESGKIEIFTADKEISLDAKPKEKSESAISHLAATERNDLWASGRDDYASGVYKVEGQLIRYKVNSKGIISAIDTTASGSGGDGDTLTFMENWKKPNNFRHNDGGFGNRDKNFVIDENTVVFAIPTGDDREDESYYTATDRSYFTGVAWYENKIECYDLSDTMCPGAIIVDATTRANADVPAYEPIFPIEKISVVTDVDGTETYKITGTVNGLEKSYVLLNQEVRSYNAIVRDKDVLDGVTNVTKTFKVGDLVQCGSNSDGRVLRVLGFVPGETDSDEIAPMGFIGYGQDLLRAHAAIAAVIGRLTAMDGMNILLDTMETDDEKYSSIYPFTLKSTTPVSIYNVSENKRYTSSTDELVKHVNDVNSRIAVITKFGAVSEVIIYDFN